MDATLTNIDTQIAEVERELAALRITKDTPKAMAKQIHRRQRELLTKHERLVMQVQRATVGAVKAGQVL